jgi:PGF-pre-PGF domain-containing protein
VYNIEKTEGKNVVGGSYLAGNFWAKPDGKGFSETAVDANGDGIADSKYKFENSTYADKLPLVSASRPQQQAAPTANFEMNTTKGSAPVSVQFTDTSQNAASLSWDFENDGTIDSMDKNPVHVYSAPGEYTINLTAANEAGTAFKTATVTVTQAAENNTGKSEGGSSGTESSKNGSQNTGNNINGNSSSGNSATENSETQGNSGSEASDNNGAGGSSSNSGSSHSSGSSGGSVGGSPEPQENVDSKEISQTYITKGEKITFDFPKNNTCVVYASFDAEKTVGKTTAIAELLKEKSSLVPELPSGEIYKFFNLWIGNAGFATSENIKNPGLCFRVEKTWIQDKKIDPASITLNRYSNESWEQLPTNLSGEDDNYLYFTAKTAGFSFFGISSNVKNKETAINNSQLNSQIETATGNLSKEGTGSMLGSEVVNALENRTSARSPGFETIYCVISLISLFLYKMRLKD